MEADIYTKYQSLVYRILDFKCRCTDCRRSKPEYNEAFCISFVRKGNFLFNVFRRSLDSYSGCVLITKPGYERTVTHTHSVPDECTILEFTESFYRELIHRYRRLPFFQDPDIHSTLVKTNPETEFLHFHLNRVLAIPGCSKLRVDALVMEIIEKIMGSVLAGQPENRIPSSLKKNHLVTIENAKEYISTHFVEDISLMEIAAHCHVSPFHFSRIFKTFAGCSPYRFLLAIRLKNAEMLLKTGMSPVADIAFNSGFNSIEHFTTAFRQKYQLAPAQFRNLSGTIQSESFRPEK